MNIWARRVTLGALIAMNLAMPVLADDSTLPFTISVLPDELKDVPNYMGRNPPIRMDFPPCPIAIDGEYWIIFRNRVDPRVFRYKGTNIEDAKRQPDGDAAQPDMNGAYILGGMWYDETEKKLYAPLHHEHLRAWKQVALATSTDKGLTWKYEGLIVAPYDPKGGTQEAHVSEGDFYLHVDKQHGYFYLYCMRYAPVAPQTRHFVARCAITNRMAPGKWTKFYNGGWTEPALGGKSSPVNAYFVMYNTFLKKYISFNLGGSLSYCSDLEKQDWSPSFKIGDAWCPSPSLYAYHVTDETKKDIHTGGRTLFVWSFWEGNWGGRSRIEFGEGVTPNTKGYTEGYHPYGDDLGSSVKNWNWLKVSMSEPAAPR